MKLMRNITGHNHAVYCDNYSLVQLSSSLLTDSIYACGTIRKCYPSDLKDKSKKIDRVQTIAINII